MASTIRRTAIVAAVALISTSAYAGPSSRSLSLADAAANEKPASDEKPAAVERPRVVAPQEQAKPTVPADKTTTVDKPRRKHFSTSTEARVIYELHRHGIYW
jgi:hypothetical protein